MADTAEMMVGILKIAIREGEAITLDRIDSLYSEALTLAKCEPLDIDGPAPSVDELARLMGVDW
ncbi:hypothetical protein [Streptomyces sp. 769]|uniref:hypothetical protein n=1 Tax=Streptomyces sp. 769 TaxID=1262452 RepID=UPI00057FC490|nr:hypothetical protein [Streptomyces sp. 769]